jgi:radical SAM superfamily enzyme YgiQ (UPF0313 family)
LLLDLTCSPKIIGTGDIFRELKEESFNVFKWIDAINFHFTTADVISYIEHWDWKIIDNMIYMHEDHLVVGKEQFDKWIRNVPIPKREMFDPKNYSNPFAMREYSSVMMTDLSCPFSCEFCPYSTINYSVRQIDDVIEEIKILKTIWINDVFFVDATFGLQKERLQKLCNWLRQCKMSRSCFWRVDNIDKEKIEMMKSAWCHTIVFGIESMNQDILDKYNKKTKISQIREAMDLCKKNKIRAGWTFIVWLPWDDEKSIRNTIFLSKTLHLDFASFNIATPRIWTHFRKDMIEKWFANPDELNLESSKQKTQVWNSHNLPLADLVRLQKSAVRSFYLNPKYIIRRLLGLKSFYELKNSIFEMYYLFFK